MALELWVIISDFSTFRSEPKRNGDFRLDYDKHQKSLRQKNMTFAFRYVYFLFLFCLLGRRNSPSSFVSFQSRRFGIRNNPKFTHRAIFCCSISFLSWEDILFVVLFCLNRIHEYHGMPLRDWNWKYVLNFENNKAPAAIEMIIMRNVIRWCILRTDQIK